MMRSSIRILGERSEELCRLHFDWTSMGEGSLMEALHGVLSAEGGHAERFLEWVEREERYVHSEWGDFIGDHNTNWGSLLGLLGSTKREGRWKKEVPMFHAYELVNPPDKELLKPYRYEPPHV